MSSNLIPFPETHHAAEVSASPSADRTTLPALTARERQVLRLAYLTNKEIAWELRDKATEAPLSEHTIRAFFRQIAIKFGTKSRTEAYVRWMEWTGQIVEMQERQHEKRAA